MADLFYEVVQFFTDDGWRFEQVRDLSILQMGFKTDEQSWLCYAQVNEEEKCFLFYSIYPQDIPREMRTAVAEYITRVNFGLFIGNFELDYGDGEVRYKTSIAATASQPDRDLLRNTVHANLGAMERYMPGLDQVVNENQSPAEVLRWIDAD